MLLLAAEQAGKGGSAVGSLLTFALIGGAMYMLVLRPQRARAKGVATAQAALEPGREVILTSGIYGRVLSVEQDRVALEIAPGVTVQVARGAVSKVIDLQPTADVDDPGTPLG